VIAYDIPTPPGEKKGENETKRKDMCTLFKFDDLYLSIPLNRCELPFTDCVQSHVRGGCLVSMVGEAGILQTRVRGE
jgi:hypothetical protein